MGTVTEEHILQQLSKVKGPDLESNVVDLGMVSKIVIDDADNIIFSLTVDPGRARELEPLREAAEKAVQRIEGVGRVLVALTAESAGSGPGASPAAPPRRPPPPGNLAPPPPMGGQASPPKAAGVPGVKAIVAVASGKGGVGKSTTAVNLALGLQARGLKVGIARCRYLRPSMPRLLASPAGPTPVSGRRLKPMDGYGLKVMSMGFLVEEDTPMIWRGPMVMSALTQMLREVAWGELDVLVVDMPPGTGDAQLTMAQQVPLAGCGHRLHAAGPGADRCAQGPQHVPPRRCAGARHHRKYELFPVPALRRALRHFRPWRRPHGSRETRR